VALVRARVRLSETRESYSSIALVDVGARMTLIDKSLAERVGIQFTGRAINFASVSGHVVKALEAVIPELEIEGEALKYEAVAVAEVPERVREVLRKSEMDENVIVGLLTIERANMMPDTATGVLRRVESFIL
jgi:hypothetical protein